MKLLAQPSKYSKYFYYFVRDDGVSHQIKKDLKKGGIVESKKYSISMPSELWPSPDSLVKIKTYCQ